MAIKKLDFKSTQDEVTISYEGTALAVIRYSLNKIYQVELLHDTSRTHEHQILAHVYLLSNESSGEETKALSEVLALAPHELRNSLRSRNIATVRVAYSALTEALAAVLKRLEQKFLSVEIFPHELHYRDHVHLHFSLHCEQKFSFWRSVMAPDAELDGLHIVPSYHPLLCGKKPIHMINGDTDHRVHGFSIVRVESPLEARAKMEGRRRPSTWAHLSHPYHAEGRAILVTVREGLLRTKDGVRELARFLNAALGKTDEYVEVSGGFRAPFLCAHNLLITKNLPCPRAGNNLTHETRGSEEFCVWAYRTLLAEGKLDGAYIPKWFIEEGWQGIYEGAEEKPGLY